IASAWPTDSCCATPLRVSAQASTRFLGGPPPRPPRPWPATRTPHSDTISGTRYQRRLEVIFESKLHDTRIARAQDASKIRAVRSRRRVVEACMIQDVEHFPAELERPLAEPEVAADAEVVLQPRRPRERVRLQGAVGARGRRRKGGGVQIIVHRLVAEDVVED